MPDRATGSLAQLVQPLLLRTGAAEESDCSEEESWGGEGETVPGREIGDVPGIGEGDVLGIGGGSVPWIEGGFVPGAERGFVPRVGGGDVLGRCQCLQVHWFRQVHLLEQHLQVPRNEDVPCVPSTAALRPSGTRRSVGSRTSLSRTLFHVHAKPKVVVQAIQESPCPWPGCFPLSTSCGLVWEGLFLYHCLFQIVPFHWCLPLGSDWPVEYCSFKANTGSRVVGEPEWGGRS